MSTTTKRSTPPPPNPPPPTAHGTGGAPRGSAARVPWLLRGFDAIYRFLASLKLAVISLSSLAAVLAYATFFEKKYGTSAVQQYIYQSPLFGLLLAFLGINILCAALIRFPWTKRQTGFVITHGGLLVVLLGSFVSLKVTFDGQLGMVEGDESSQIVRIDYPAIRVQPLDPETGAPKTEYQIPFHPGAFAWEGRRSDVLTTPSEPFALTVKDFIPASSLVYYAPKPGEGGVPMIRAGAYITPPNSDQAVDIFARADTTGRNEVRWLKADHPRFRRSARDFGSLLFAFQYADTPAMVEDFLALPDDPLTQDLIRIHYRDRAGKDRVYTWPRDMEEGQGVTLPDSDITATLASKASVPITRLLDPDGQMIGALGDPTLSYVEFQVTRGDGKPEKYLAASGLPSLPNNPGAADPAVRIHYFHPYEFGEAMQGRSSVIEVLGTPEGKLYYRALSREGLRGKGPLAEGKRIELVRQSQVQPVTFSFEVEEYLTSGVDGDGVDAVNLPVGQKDKGIPAALVELTVGGTTKELWLRQSNDLSPKFRTVTFPGDGGTYRVSYDFDRKELPFSLKLTDFDVGMDPGTNQPSSYESDVLLTDAKAGVEDRPTTISMNEPLVWKNYTFYQSNYVPVSDPATGRPTGQFMSIFQVRYDPVWGITYAGCLLVVLGTFVQFYMRAGIFTDGGQRARERAARRAAAAGAPAPTPEDEIL